MARTAVIVCVFLGCLATSNSAPTDDACSEQTADFCLNDVMFIGNPDLDVPAVDATVDKFCGIAKERVEPCVRDFIKDCMKSFPKQVATILVNSVMREVDLWCGDDREVLLNNAQCLAGIKGELDACMKDFIIILDSISRHDDEDNIIPHACCEFGGFRQCAIDSTSAACSDETVEFVDKVITSYTSEIMDIACTNYKSGSAECDALPEVDFKALAPNGTIYKTPLPPLLKVVERL